MARTRRKSRSEWGSIDRLPSRRWRLRYTDGTGALRSAGTFPTEKEARAARDRLRSETHLGLRVYSDVDETVGAYVERWIDNSTNLAPGTRALYQRIVREWIHATLERGRWPICIGEMPIGKVSSRTVEDWFGAVVDESTRRARARAHRGATSTQRINADIRAFARSAGIPVAPTGRVPAEARGAWEAAGGLARLTAGVNEPNAGKTEAAQAYRLLKAVFSHAARNGVGRRTRGRSVAPRPSTSATVASAGRRRWRNLQ